jgi:hypothetical protein
MDALAHGQQVEGAAGTGRETGPVEEDAGAVDQPCAPATLLQAGCDAFPGTGGEMLPFVGLQVGGRSAAAARTRSRSDSSEKWAP